MRKIILDCDPGHDDAFAWALAARSPELELLGVTVTYGNTKLEHTYRNAKVLADILGSTCPIHAGASEPLLRERISAEAAHGSSGLEGPTLPPSEANQQPRTAVQFIIEQVLQHPHQVTLVPVGPLTKLALAMRLEPSIVPKIQEIALMGGSTGHGNFTPVAEFNILADPHAAQVVFSSGAPLTMFGLNVTEEAMLYQTELNQLRQQNSQVGRFLGEVLEFFLKAHQGWGFKGASLHDPCPVAYLIQPDLFQFEMMRVEVDTTGGIGFGQTVCDKRSKNPNVKVAVGVDYAGFRKLLLDRLRLYA